MRKHWIARVLLASCIALPPSALAFQRPAVVRPVAPDFSTARGLIRERMARDSLPGLAIAVVHADSIVWEEGFGWANRETRVPATPHTPFYLASLSKTITATALMVLREQGDSTSTAPRTTTSAARDCGALAGTRTVRPCAGS